MCQVMGFLMRRRLGSRAEAGIPKLGPPDLGFPTAGVGVSLPCPEGEQARRMVASHHPMCDTLAAPCRMGSRKALRINPDYFPSLVHPYPASKVYRYAGLAFVQGSIALGSSAGVSPSRPAPPSRSLSIARARLVRRSSFAVFESPVTRDKTMCSGHPIR